MIGYLLTQVSATPKRGREKTIPISSENTLSIIGACIQTLLWDLLLSRPLTIKVEKLVQTYTLAQPSRGVPRTGRAAFKEMGSKL